MQEVFVARYPFRVLRSMNCIEAFQVIEELLIRITWLYKGLVVKIISLIEVFQARVLTVFLAYYFLFVCLFCSVRYWTTCLREGGGIC